MGTALWSAAMAASAATGLLARGWSASPELTLVSGLFAFAGLLAFVPAAIAAQMLSAGRTREFRLAMNLLFLTGATVGAAALLYALQYRFYYDEWHAPVFSTVWFFELGFTGIAALYQFAVLGTRLFFPIGFVALLAAACWLTGRRLSKRDR